MKIIELFSGSGILSQTFKENGHEVFRIDNKLAFNTDWCASIECLNIGMFPKEWRNPDVIWASPPCTAFSIAAVGHHWKEGKPSDEAINAIKLVAKTMELIMLLRPKYWFIENPRGMLRKMPIMASLNKTTITYCQYGDSRMKPTDIWHNCLHWKPKPMCKNGMPCHISAPRGSKTGTQGLSNAFERGKLPKELCEEIVRVCEGKND